MAEKKEELISVCKTFIDLWFSFSDLTFSVEEMDEGYYINFEKYNLGVFASKDGLKFDAPIDAIDWIWLSLFQMISNVMDEGIKENDEE